MDDHGRQARGSVFKYSPQDLFLPVLRLSVFVCQMTQLTRSRGTALDRKQDGGNSRSPSPFALCEGCASNRMARVRRNSQSNRRRQGSERSDHHQSTKAGGQTGSFQLPSLQQAVPYATPLAERPLQHHVAVLPQLETSGWMQNTSNFAVTRSPEAFISSASPVNSNLSVTGHDSKSLGLFDRNRTLSPSEFTPTQSTTSLDRSESLDELTASLQGQGRRDSVENAFFDRGINYS